MQEFIIKLKHRIEGKYFSNFDSIFKGSGLEVDDFRNYVAGDSPKAINWKITAKLDKVFVNIFQEEKSVNLDVFLDINYNRNGKSNNGYNGELALNLFGDILIYAKKHLLPLTLYLPNENKYHINHDLSEAYAFLQKFPQYLKNTSKKYHSYLTQFLDEAKKNKKKRAIVIISDFLAMDDSNIRLLKQLQKDHSIYLFRLAIDTVFGQNYEQKIDITKNLGIRIFDL